MRERMLGTRTWSCKALILLAGLTAAAPARADVLHLQDGTRYNGTLISENQVEVVFEIVLNDGRSTFRKTFARTSVKGIERRALDVAQPKAPERDDRTELESRDADQILREAFELLDNGDMPAALRALQRLVRHAAVADLPTLSDKCRRERGVPLDELLARTRLVDALSQRSGRLVALETATHYESAVLSRLAAEKIDTLLSTAHAGKSIQEWATQPEGYQLAADTIGLVREARIAAGLIAARLKVDDQFRHDTPERRRLRGLQDQLARLVTRITTMHGYTGVGAAVEDDADPTVSEARQLASRPAASQPTSQPERAESDENGEGKP